MVHDYELLVSAHRFYAATIREKGERHIRGSAPGEITTE